MRLHGFWQDAVLAKNSRIREQAVIEISERAEISIVFGPTYVEEEAHLSLFRTHYNEDLDEDVAELWRSVESATARDE